MHNFRAIDFHNLFACNDAQCSPGAGSIAGQGLKGAQCLSPVQPFTLRQMLLPAVAFELGIEMFLLRKADAEIGDELPRRRHIERAADFCRIEDRHPADANALRARREPKRMNGGGGGIIQRLWHGFAAKTKACFRRMVAENGKVNRRVMQSRELEARIEGRALSFVGFESGRVAGIEVRDNRPARRRRFHADKAPRLAVADRRRKGGRSNKAFDKRWRQRIGLETPDIAPPGKEFRQAVAKAVIEYWRFGFWPLARLRLPFARRSLLSAGQSIRLRSGNAAHRRPRPHSPCLRAGVSPPPVRLLRH
jgi:hypothetical protein